jgi:L-Ala-D/L-Glu epimerase
MPTRTITVTSFQAPLQAPFVHASARRATAESLIVTARSAVGHAGWGEGCPRSYVTGESLAGAMAFARQVGPELAAEVRDIAGLRAWIAREAALIDANPAAFCALEMALIDLLARERGIGAEALLGQPELAGTFRYTAVLGDSDPDAFARLFRRYRDAGFCDFKVKLSGDLVRDRAKLAILDALAAGGDRLRIRVDANNRWRRADECNAFFAGLGRPLFAIEEPLAARDFAGLREVAAATGARIVLDESFLRVADLHELAPTASHWLLNCRVSKQGGVIRSLAIAAEARRRGFQLIVGAHVGETSLLTRAALPVAQAAGSALAGQEGAFGTHLLSHDPCTPLLMFSGQGVLHAPGEDPHSRLGWGIAVDLE